MRAPTDDCLLCKKAKAIKKNSHIISKYLGKSMLQDGGKSVGYLVSSATPEKPAGKIQDIVKEDYILCSDCEQYFSILEAIASRKVLNGIRDPAQASNFLQEIKGGVKYKICLTIDPKIFHLFILSLIWRCSISTDPFFSSFKLEPKLEEEIRNSLLAYRVMTEKNFLANVATSHMSLVDVTYAFKTYENIADPTRNVLSPIPSVEPYSIFMNEYFLILSTSPNRHQKGFATINNYSTGSNQIKIGILSEEEWNTFTGLYKDIVGQKMLETAAKRGVRPYMMDNPVK